MPMPDIPLELSEVVPVFNEQRLLHPEVAINVRNKHIQSLTHPNYDLLLHIKIEEMLISFKLKYLIQLAGLGVEHSEDVIILCSEEHFQLGREVKFLYFANGVVLFEL